MPSFAILSSSKNNAKEIGNLKKRNFLGQALDFLPPRKPGLYKSRKDCSLNIMNRHYAEVNVLKCQDLDISDQI